MSLRRQHFYKAGRSRTYIREEAAARQAEAKKASRAKQKQRQSAVEEP
jgi:hypothetical protein